MSIANKASKGKNGGRTVPLRAELRDALLKLHAHRNPDDRDLGRPERPTFWACFGGWALDALDVSSGMRTCSTETEFLIEAMKPHLHGASAHAGVALAVDDVILGDQSSIATI
jgi:hypothetical protein